MDRTHAITRLNTEEIATEVNNVIKKGLDKLLGDYLYRYELLEQTHDAIMNLPSVRNHLNQDPLPRQQYNAETKVDDVKYDQILEKLLKRIDELTFEVNQLKQTRKNDCTDIKVEDDLIVVKLEQRENIRLEIEEESVASLEEADDESVAQSEADASESDEDASEAGESVLSKAESLEEEENICSECDCKVILDEDIVVVDGKKYCGACDPTSSKEEDASEEEEDDVEEEEEEEEEVVEEDDVEEEVVEEVVEEDVEEEVVEEVVVKEDDVETEKSESVAGEEEEEEFIEIDIDDVTYCTNNEENGFIYELTEDGDVGDKIGYLKDGEPFFYADEK
jgi:thiol-disulfide isomerase/thioredoxin